LLSADGATQGSQSLDLVGPFSSANFYIQAVEGFTGQVTLTASAPGFNDGVSTATVVQPGIRLLSVNSSYGAGDADDPIWADIGPQSNGSLTDVQPVRAGGVAVTVTFTSSDAAAARLVTNSQTGGAVTATIDPQASRTPTSVNLDGVAIDPLVAGSTTVTVTASGFVSGGQASQDVTINP
jgi:hypothetical protein